MSKRYVLEVQESSEGELYVELPTELTEEMGWYTGDVIEYFEDDSETICLRKAQDWKKIPRKKPVFELNYGRAR